MGEDWIKIQVKIIINILIIDLMLFTNKIDDYFLMRAELKNYFADVQAAIVNIVGSFDYY